MSAIQSTKPTAVLEGKRAGGVKTLPPVGSSLAALVGALACGLALFATLLHQHDPGPGWLILGLTLIAVYVGYRSLPGLRERAALSSARSEAKRLLKAVKRAADRQKSWTGSDTREKLDAVSAELEESLSTNETSAILEGTKALDELADRTLTMKAAVREYAEQIGGALIAALILRSFFYEAFKIPSGSMEPTLLIGDHLFVNKFVYGLRIPFTVKKVFTQYPERGDIVVFNRPFQESGDDIIKRVIGLPGDVIEVHDRHVTVNGKPLPIMENLPPEELNEDGDSNHITSFGPFTRVQPFEETIGTHHHIALKRQNQKGPEGQWTVEPGKIFVMGDNRDNSQDSRFAPSLNGFGQVPVDYIKGRADIIWLSLGGPHGVRFDRFFKRLD